MPANTKNVQINLLGDSELTHTPVGRIIGWAVTYGRYIMIGTEIVVLLAFISRFSLDRKLTDLKEELMQKQMIIEANLPFEKDVRSLQDRLAKISTLLKPPLDPMDILLTIQSSIPADVHLQTLEISDGKLRVSGQAGSTAGFARFTNKLQSSSNLTNIELGDIRRTPVKGIQFSFTATIVGRK